MKIQRTLFGTVMISLSMMIVFFIVIISVFWLFQSFVAYQHFDVSQYVSFYDYLINIPAPQMLLIVLFGMFLIGMMAKIISYQLKRSFARFHDAFAQAIQKRELIDPKQFRFKEFANLSVLVNPLIEKIIFNEKQLQTIIDAQNSMILTRSHNKLLIVNRAFLEFFNVNSLKAFRTEHSCISEFFETDEEENFLPQNINGVHWVNYILRNPLEPHKVKITKNGQTYIFSVDAKVTTLHSLYRVVITLTDISTIESERKSLLSDATTDALTKVSNRLKFETILEQQIELTNRYKNSFCLIMLDVDNFKKINDTYGHGVGDKVLVELASTIKNSIRKSDTIARWGGEEFVVILPHTRLVTGVKIAEKLRKKIEEIKIEGAPRFTCSFGISEYKKDQSIESFMHSVDTKLYEAKNSGKNCVVSA